ncbi:prepilin-type N-terminal cleavage/methylation domain-containing protein [Clostridium algidicarnis]|uniref:type IV pilus modification PilV family protein n=1 Tax=Clostridium algidicarnis TaxID=37659 RepID=UPI001C0CF0DB|nr:prepilin-type N-terminal cleavage/methylation domain-containing protein [Clostridium algidicarnis]MBU3206713.1 prepilin-type N-terminal cleavage/methylation domain-containing protein [Clostridium algidicarnis]
MKDYKVKKAMTLIEVLISLAILSIIMIPIFTMSISAVKINKGAEVKQKAMLLAQQVTERIKAVPEENFYEIDTYFKDADIKIIKDNDVNKTETFLVSGTIEGYKVEGRIEPDSNYKVLESTESKEIKVDTSIFIEDPNNIKIDKDILEGNSKDINLSVEGSKIIIKYDGKTKTKDLKMNSLALYLGRDIKETYNINVSNKIAEPFKIYCYKDKDTKGEYKINNLEGTVRHYDNLLTLDNTNQGKNRIYKIYIKVSKGGGSYDISTYKVIEK